MWLSTHIEPESRVNNIITREHFCLFADIHPEMLHSVNKTLIKKTLIKRVRVTSMLLMFTQFV